MDWQIGYGLAIWSRIGIRLTRDWNLVGDGLADWKWIGGLVLDLWIGDGWATWYRIGIELADWPRIGIWQISLRLAFDWWTVQN